MEHNTFDNESTNSVASFIKRKVLIIAAIVFGLIVFFCVFVFDPFHLNLTIRPSSLSIEKTDNVVSEIKKISEFTTASYFTEQFVLQKRYKHFDRKIYATSSTGSKIKDALGFDNKVIGTVRDSSETGELIALIVKCKVRAGFNLSHLSEEDLQIKGDTLFITMPKVEIFDVIMNPSDVEVYHRKGKWSSKQVLDIQEETKSLVAKQAEEYGLLETARKGGLKRIKDLFKTFGFAEVVLNE